MTNAPYIADITLDRNNPTPLYFQIATPIAELINSGELPAGTMLEDELSMASRLQVSRPTARQALQRLVDQGLLTRRRGVGTIVSPTKVHRPMELTSLHSDLLRAGHKVSTEILSREEHLATPEEAELLEIKPETPIVQFTRLRSSDGNAIALMKNLLPADIAPTREELTNSSLYEHFKRHQIVPTTAHQVIGAKTATTQEAASLGDKRGTALLTAKRTTYDANGRVIEYGDHIYLASRYSFETTLFSA